MIAEIKKDNKKINRNIKRFAKIIFTGKPVLLKQLISVEFTIARHKYPHTLISSSDTKSAQRARTFKILLEMFKSNPH